MFDYNFVLPVIVTGPGSYVTRGGETIEVTRVKGLWSYGTYSCGTRESWTTRGRIFSGITCKNDIVAKAAP